MIQVIDQKINARGLGASIAAACLGVSPWMSPIGAWMLLTGRTASKASQASEWGHILEPVIRGYYAARNGFDKPGQIEIAVPVDSIYHPSIPWLRATPDGFVRQTVDDSSFYTKRVQVKNVGPRTAWHWGPEKARSVPPHYRIQNVVESSVTGVRDCDFAALFSGSDFDQIAVPHDQDLEDMVIDSLATFWRLVETDTPPEVDHADGWRTYFADRLPTERSIVKADPYSLEPLIDAWKDARDSLKAAIETEAKIKNQILAAAVEARANRIDSDHGSIAIVQPKGRDPYVKAPTTWGVE